MDITGAVDIGRASLAAGTAEKIGGGNFMAWIFGMERAGEATYGQKPVATLFRRRSLQRPLVHGGGRNDMFTSALGKGNEVAQKTALCPEFEPQRPVQRYMIGEELTQHTGSPGQGWAICASIAISTLA
ncbi:hypothetical protein A3731_43350 [Roseovarius sp. HI0049]|nr:hypothetical protein A3731_43350 [Roseovarius sp. HI0049]